MGIFRVCVKSHGQEPDFEVDVGADSIEEARALVAEMYDIDINNFNIVEV